MRVLSGRIGRVGLVALATAGALLACAAVAIALTGDMPHPGMLAALQAVVVATPIAVGLYAWRDGTHARFGRLLVLAGVGWFLAALSSSSDEVVFSIGRVAAWLVEAGLVWLVLAFPSGRLATPIDRWLTGAVFALVGLLFLPTALLTEEYPALSPYSTCSSDCPENAFMLVSSEPAWVEDVLVPLRELLASAVLVAVVVRLAQRIRHATRLLRKTLAPVLAFAMLRTLSIAVGLGLRRAGADDAVLTVATTVIVLCLPALSIGFLIGLLRWRLHAADSLISLGQGLLGRHEPAQVRDLIAATLSDPTAELAYFRGGTDGGWVDASGRTLPLPPPPPDRLATVILDGDDPVAAVIHDAALSEQRQFVAAVGAYAFVWDDNRRLSVRVQSSLRELHASRARILAAADDERRRIERDLHDGGQQRLVALRIRLELAEELMGQHPSRARRMLHKLGGDIDAALDELRSLAAGVYPSLLTSRGLPDALRTAALQSPVPASVVVDGSDRYSREIETAAYFCCVEALQNVAKHAPDASAVVIRLHCNGDLRFEVQDDGPGFAVTDETTGGGLTNMQDRIASVGGELVVRSTPAAGTTVTGMIPSPSRVAQ